MIELSLSATILAEIEQNPGITSPEICAKFPALNKKTVTSKISKLKARDLIYSEEASKFQSVGLFIKDKSITESPVAAGGLTPPFTPPRPRPVPAVEAPLNYTKEEVIQVLKPLAEFAEKMKSNGIPSQLNVWVSATTNSPTVFVAPGSWFMNALDLLKKMA